MQFYDLATALKTKVGQIYYGTEFAAIDFSFTDEELTLTLVSTLSSGITDVVVTDLNDDAVQITTPKWSTVFSQTDEETDREFIKRLLNSIAINCGHYK